MNKAQIIINSCEKCPNLKRERIYTEDSWEHVEELTCKLAKKVVSGYFERMDTANIPDWCPIKIEE